MKNLILPGAIASLLVAFVLCGQADEAKKEKETIIEVMEKSPEQPKAPVRKTEEEWKKELTPEQYRILREDGTERANGKVYEEFKKQGAGTYYCAGCNAELFTSNEKFDSHCGWPSFYDPAKAKNVKYETDYLLGYARTEVSCKICEGHLGHVFEGEGFETPTDKRYCINGTVLKFVPAEKEAPKQEKAE
ncbi:MAG: peptide-methionine (R)-S-oxide reductase MsrB [Verrucomicrobiales bacterium]|nr:peptide-methionine (R)-S-oxide reductase MsrB [Verrucomicrobiales bacterium]